MITNHEIGHDETEPQNERDVRTIMGAIIQEIRLTNPLLMSCIFINSDLTYI
jgi:hypothetical protein